MYYSIAIKHYQPYVLLWWLVYLSDILITECRRQGTDDQPCGRRECSLDREARGQREWLSVVCADVIGF